MFKKISILVLISIIIKYCYGMEPQQQSNLPTDLIINVQKRTSPASTIKILTPKANDPITDEINLKYINLYIEKEEDKFSAGSTIETLLERENRSLTFNIKNNDLFKSILVDWENVLNSLVDGQSLSYTSNSIEKFYSQNSRANLSVQEIGKTKEDITKAYQKTIQRIINFCRKPEELPLIKENLTIRTIFFPTLTRYAKNITSWLRSNINKILFGATATAIGAGALWYALKNRDMAIFSK